MRRALRHPPATRLMDATSPATTDGSARRTPRCCNARHGARSRADPAQLEWVMRFTIPTTHAARPARPCRVRARSAFES
jgi:hypothetical protein